MGEEGYYDGRKGSSVSCSNALLFPDEDSETLPQWGAGMKEGMRGDSGGGHHQEEGEAGAKTRVGWCDPSQATSHVTARVLFGPGYAASQTCQRPQQGHGEAEEGDGQAASMHVNWMGGEAG